MAISATNIISAATTTSGTSFTTASVTPTADVLQILSISSILTVTGTNVAPTITGGGLTWTLIIRENEANDKDRQVAIFWATGASPSTGALTIDFGSTTQGGASWSLEEFTGTDVLNSGAGTIVQNVGNLVNNTTTAGITVTLAALGSTDNVAYGFIRMNLHTTVTVGSGFTSLSNITGTSASYTAEWKLNDTAVAFSWGSGQNRTEGAAIEIKALVVSVSVPRYLVLTKGPAGVIIANQAFNDRDGGYSGYNHRLVIPTSLLATSVAGWGYVTVVFNYYLDHNGTCDSCYIGHQGSGQVYNFDGNQVRATFNNGSVSSTVATAINVAVTTDSAGPFYYRPGTPLIISTHWSGTTVTGLANTVPGPLNCNQHFSGADQASANAPTGAWTQNSFWAFIGNVSFFPKI